MPVKMLSNSRAEKDYDTAVVTIVIDTQNDINSWAGYLLKFDSDYRSILARVANYVVSNISKQQMDSTVVFIIEDIYEYGVVVKFTEGGWDSFMRALRGRIKHK